MNSINSLHQECKKVSDDVVKTLTLSCKSMKKLNLSNCKLITNDGLLAISQNCTSLQSLSLNWGSKFTATAISSLASKCALKKLDLRECKHITGKASYLMLSSHCEDEYLIGLAQVCCSLEELLLDSCYKLTDNSISLLSKYCPIKVIR